MKALVFGKVNGFVATTSLLVRSITFDHWTFHRGADPGEVTLSPGHFIWYEVVSGF